MIKVVHQFRFALIGCENIANRHAENILRIGRLVAVCDNDKQRAFQFAATYNCIPYFDFDDLLKSETEVDIIEMIHLINKLYTQSFTFEEVEKRKKIDRTTL